jgi:hypothetical protein
MWMFDNMCDVITQEGYVTETRDDQEPTAYGKRVYEFGVRFFVEVSAPTIPCPLCIIVS